ncbi:hypothetical protein BEWA_016990 [Theileria equi strain WA]|uniref:Uncharacterized protein n=1 Tax=Theileria equi strain WA TaxID=1537102 RepID=L1L9Z6_THEEQ|nr:hypothetical protein BEWA_016990 [Theileria equi strain WA]EKX72020.1 hypothetical protein BEWA_016990 [Theileria equi strain WA]|eukprot:XP_004831472.1 hypothetical protein BEWA_016990 [Theileria equi strain WA]
MSKTLNLLDMWNNFLFIDEYKPEVNVSCYSINRGFDHIFKIGKVMEGNRLIVGDEPFLYHRSVNVIDDLYGKYVWINNILLEDGSFKCNTIGFKKENDTCIRLVRKVIDFDVNEVPEMPLEMEMKNFLESKKQVYSVKRSLVRSPVIGTIYCGEYIMHDDRCGILEKSIIIDRSKHGNLIVTINEENNDWTTNSASYEFIPQENGIPFVAVQDI